MLETLRKNQQNWLIGFFLLIICAVFVINFGPQSQGCGAQSGAKTAARVAGATVSESQFRAAYRLARGYDFPVKTQRALKMRQSVMDGLVERELLAREARRLGMAVTEDDVDKEVLAGRIYRSSAVSSPSWLGSGPINYDFKDDRGVFQYEDFKRFVQRYLHRSLREFKDEQATEILAERMREIVRSSVRIGETEVWEAYGREKLEVSVKYVRFSPLYYRDTLEPTAEQIAEFRRTSAADVNREYDRQKHRYTKLDKQARSRHILLKVAPAASDEEKAARRTELEGILARARAGESFAALARQHSEDTGSGRRGGDLGWHKRGDMVEPFANAEFALTPGGISDIVESQFGVHVIQLIGFREGDVPEEEAKNEIAERLYRERTAQDRARTTAEQALAKLKAGETLDAVNAWLVSLDAPPAPPTPPGQPVPPAVPPSPDAHPADDGHGHDADDEDAEEDELAPRVRETSSFNRGGNPIPGPYDPQPLVRAAFDLSTEHPVAQELVRAGDSYFVMVLKERTDPSRTEFDTQRPALTRRLRAEKQRDALAQFVARLRAEAEADGEVDVNDEMLVYEDEQGERQEEDQPAGDEEGEDRPAKATKKSGKKAAPSEDE